MITIKHGSMEDNMNILEIPYEVITVLIPENYKFNGDIYPIKFYNKRKSTNSSINRIKENMARDLASGDIPLIPEVYTLKNGLFELELSKSYHGFYISHPDLPVRPYKYYINFADNVSNFFDLLINGSNINSRSLSGKYYFDPKRNFFILNNKYDELLQNRVLAGEYLKTPEKLVPGNLYMIEHEGICKRLIYLGKVNNIIRYNNYSSDIIVNLSNQKILSSYYGLFMDTTSTFNLFKSEIGVNYYLFQNNRIKKGGLIKSGVDNGMTNDEFHSMCINNNWFIGLNHKNNLDQMKEIVVNCIIDKLKSTNGCLHVGRIFDDNQNWWGMTDISQYDPDYIFARLKRDKEQGRFLSEDITMFRSLFDVNIFGPLSDDEIKSIITEAWLGFKKK